MPRDIDKRLSQLRVRRAGLDRITRVDEEFRPELMSRYLQDETWQKRTADKPYTRYALGAMAEVDPDYTRISVETAERVGSQLKAALAAEHRSVELRLQGSVPLNVHIRGVSDVDLLNLDAEFLTYRTSGARARAGRYTSPSSRTSVEVLSSLRSSSERILRDKYPKATVDTSGAKAITIYGGSLPRAVDVVPSHWYDGEEYQNSLLERDRGVVIYNKTTAETIENWPFQHIHRVHERDGLASGGLKKAIRLCKNVKNDAVSEGKTIVFPSFDIASMMYHADIANLRHGYVYELAVLAETQRFLDYLYHHEDQAKSMWVPDGSRRIFDTPEKLAGMKSLSVEMDDLAREVAKEQSSVLKYDNMPDLGQVRSALGNTYVL